MKNQHESFYLIFNRKKMKYPPFIPDKCLADHKVAKSHFIDQLNIYAFQPFLSLHAPKIP